MSDRAEAESPTLADALGISLVTSLPLAALTALRLESTTGIAPCFVVVLGATALSLGVIAVIVRTAGTDGVALVVGKSGLVASFPVAQWGALLAAKTHHRALGGVTFSFGALVLVVSSWAVIARLSALARSGNRLAAAAVTTLVVGSPGLTAALLAHHASNDGYPRDVSTDLALFSASAIVVAVVARTGRFRFPDAAASRLGVAWALVVVVGCSVAIGSMPLRAILSEHAPFSLGLAGLLGR